MIFDALLSIDCKSVLARLLYSYQSYWGDNMNASRNDVLLFLYKVKFAISNGKIIWIPRTYSGITELGINLQVAIDIILELTPQEFYRGPSFDHNGDGQMIWEFIYDYNDETCKKHIYIKLKFVDPECKVLSFHISRKPFFRPYRHGGDNNGTAH